MAGLSKSTYSYYHSNKHLTALHNKAKEEDRILSIITPIFTHHKKRYGSRRIILASKDKLKGINHKKIERIMSDNNLKARQGKNGKYHSYKGDNGEFKENLLLVKDENDKLVRNFNTTHSSEVWATDVSEFKCDEGKLYLSPIKDLYDDSIVSYDVSSSPDFNQTKKND